LRGRTAARTDCSRAVFIESVTTIADCEMWDIVDRTPDSQVPGSFAALYTSLGSRPDERGRQFERVVKWFLKNDPAWSTQVDEVWLWNDWPERWGADCGIDLIFRHKNGEMWAVQAKCYSPDYTVTKHDVDRFLSESNRSLIQRRLLVATTDRIGTNALRVCEAQEKPVVLLRLSDFNSSLLDYPSDFEHLHQSLRRPRPVPRDHQNEAVAAVSNGLRGADRGQLIMACGTGKTYVTLWVKEALNAQRTLVLVPSLGLLSQLLREWTHAASVPFELLCVCSDESVSGKAGDDAVHSVMDLAFRVTSDAAEVRAFLCGAGNRVVISTYQSSLVVAAAQAEPSIPAFDLAIADEAHRCAGKVGGDFSAILNNEQIRSAKRLFATATPRIYSRSVKSAAEARGVEVVGMDDHTLFGAVLYALPFGKAIERKLLTDYRVVIIGVDDATIAQWIDQRKLVSTGTGVETDSESLAAQIGLLKAMKDYDLKRVISFHSRVSRAEGFITELQKVSDWISDEHRPSGDLHADFVSGNMPAGKRKVKLDRLKELRANERAVLSNARCLAEGVDVPSLDGVAFIDPRSSHVDIVQAVGRAIRLSPEKKTGTIILPVFLKSAANAVSAIETSNFKPIWEVLDALKAHDDVLAWDLDQIRTEMGRTPGTSVSADDLGKLGISLPSAVDESFGTALRTYLVEQVTVSWNFWFGLLEAYVQEHGNAWVSAKHVTRDGYKLGMWVNGQRNAKLNGQLSEERISRLESLPGWVWDAYKEKWEAGLSALMDYVRVHGDAKVPLKYVTPQGFGLGNWISTARRKKSTGQLAPDRISRLEAVPGWSWSVLEGSWEDGFRMLEEYVAERGDARVPTTFVAPDGYKLGDWVDRQRGLRLKRRLDQGRELRLDGLPGWSWERKKIARRSPLNWDDAFRLLVEYASREGDAVVPRRYVMSDGFCLGLWVHAQRKSQKSLSTDQRAMLEALPGWRWAVQNNREAFRERGLRELQEFVSREGHARVPMDYVTGDGFRLGGWVQKQRSKANRLPLGHKAKLETLPDWSWDVLADKWEEGFRHLVEFAGRQGHAMVSVGFVAEDGYPLGRWVQLQRRLKSNTSGGFSEGLQKLAEADTIPGRGRSTDSEMRQWRIDRLESIQGWVWRNPKQERWGIGFEKLLEYVKSHGDAKVPQAYVTPEGFRLGNWVAIARRKKLKNQLGLDRIKELEVIPGWSWGIPDDAWEQGLRIAGEYIAAGGEPNVPRGYVTAGGYRLGAWIDRQRLLWMDRRLDQHRADRLAAIPGWSWERDEGPNGSIEWESAFSRLLEYLDREGHVAVPRDYETSDGFHLGNWVRSQRKSRSRLSAERKKRLDELPGWKWVAGIPGELRWQQAFEALLKFVAVEGHARVAKDFITDSGIRLGSWVQSRRSEIDQLSLERKAQLEALPGWTWDALRDRWEQGYRHIAEFAELEGHSKVRHDFVAEDGYRLGSWVHNQRNQRMKMSEQRRTRLEALPGWRWPNESLEWNDWIVRLKEFALQNGHTRVPQLFKTSDGFLLGRWVNSRRTKRDRLSPDQQAELESLPGWVWRAT
jgi:superfamily II DNA or RNA helicase